MMTPSPGTKLFAETYTKGLVIARAGGREVRPYMYDGNYVIASSHARPWRKQLNLLARLPLLLQPALARGEPLRRKTKVGMKPAYMQTGRHGRRLPIHPPHLHLGPPPDVHEDPASRPSATNNGPHANHRVHLPRRPRPGSSHHPHKIPRVGRAG